MAVELKTKASKDSVTKFLNTVTEEKRRKDCQVLVELMEKVTKKKAVMWGTAIVGFDEYHYKYASGHEGDACVIGFSPRKQALVLYLSAGTHVPKEVLKKLGKYKLSGSCLHIKNLDDVDMKVLKTMVELSYQAKKLELKQKK